MVRTKILGDLPAVARNRVELAGGGLPSPQSGHRQGLARIATARDHAHRFQGELGAIDKGLAGRPGVVRAGSIAIDKPDVRNRAQRPGGHGPTLTSHDQGGLIAPWGKFGPTDSAISARKGQTPRLTAEARVVVRVERACMGQQTIQGALGRAETLAGGDIGPGRPIEAADQESRLPQAADRQADHHQSGHRLGQGVTVLAHEVVSGRQASTVVSVKVRPRAPARIAAEAWHSRDRSAVLTGDSGVTSRRQSSPADRPDEIPTR
ncbi:MAG: hypothetical protein JF570_02175 [Caulobacter sp.]|nr:hypothetical protein [Caulobacter sp.]